jgi:hypothetical protein
VHEFFVIMVRLVTVSDNSKKPTVVKAGLELFNGMRAMTFHSLTTTIQASRDYGRERALPGCCPVSGIRPCSRIRRGPPPAYWPSPRPRPRKN